MNLFINYYIDPNPERQKEIDTCFNLNVENEVIGVTYILTDRPDNLPDYKTGKVVLCHFPYRPTFKDFFEMINKYSSPDDINVIANSDIYLGTDFDASMIKADECFALTRWDSIPATEITNATDTFYNNSGSQDTWVFRGPIKQVKGGDYTQGKPGCDNKLAYDLEQSGYKVTNPSLSIKTYHLHNTEIRHYTDKDRLPHPRKNVPITKLPKVKTGRTLLHFGLFDSKEPQQSLRDALKGICNDYIEFSWVANPLKARVDFHRLMAEHQPDVVFMQIQTPDIIKASSIVRYPDVKFFNFSGDVRPIFPAWYFDVAPYCTTLFTNTDWVDIMEQKGFKARYFQIGFNDKIYKPGGVKAETSPVVFMGNNHKGTFPLSKMREEMVNRFNKKEWFQCYGRGWDNAIDLNNKQEQQAAVYRGAKIGINISHMDLGSYTSDRMFRIMGSGAMCLAYRHKDIEKEFTEYQYHLMSWQTLDELEKLIEIYLDNDIKRSVIADTGCKLVHDHYTWEARLQKDLKPLL